MKLQITIQYGSGEGAVATVLPPEWVKWEKQYNRRMTDISDANPLGMSDLLFLAYSGIKRETAPNPMKPFDAWVESVVEVDFERINPKAMKSEVSEG